MKSFCQVSDMGRAEEQTYNMRARNAFLNIDEFERYNTFSIDTIQFTIKSAYGHEILFNDLFNMKHICVEALEFSQPYYKEWYREINSNIIYGVKVLPGGLYHYFFDMKGAVCFTLKNFLINVIRSILIHNGVFKRIDLAMDDFEGLLNMDKIERYINNGLCVGSFRSTRKWDERNSNGDLTGESIGIGSRKSKTFTRIYDKAKQMKVDYHWIRCETEFKDERAHHLGKIISESNSLEKIIPASINGHISFRERTKDKTKSRWPVADWWRKFIGDERLKFGLLKAASKEETVKLENFMRNNAKMLAKVLNQHGMDGINQMLESGQKKLIEERLGA